MLFEQKLHTIATSTREITSWTTLITTFATDINLMRIKLTGIKHEILRQKKGIVKIHRYSNRSVDGGYVIKNGISFFVMDDPKVPYNNRVHPMHPMHPFAAIKMSLYNTQGPLQENAQPFPGYVLAHCYRTEPR